MTEDMSPHISWTQSRTQKKMQAWRFYEGSYGYSQFVFQSKET